jgi:hypothetical protein
MPNPQKHKLIMWVFIKDATFDKDLEMLISGGARNDQ